MIFSKLCLLNENCVVIVMIRFENKKKGELVMFLLNLRSKKNVLLLQ